MDRTHSYVWNKPSQAQGHLSSSINNFKEKKRRRYDDPTNELFMGTKKRRTNKRTSSSPYSLKTTSLYIALPPKFSFYPEKTFRHLLSSAAGRSYEQAAHLRSLCPIAGVEKQFLDPLLMRFFEPVDGVVVAYDNIRFETSTAKIVAECPYAHIWTKVDMLVWRPLRGMCLDGWVNLQSASHIGLLVDNTWNVSIPQTKIPPEWHFEETELSAGTTQTTNRSGCWIKQNDKLVEGKLRFMVESVEADGNIFVVHGNLQHKGDAVNADCEVRSKSNR